MCSFFAGTVAKDGTAVGEGFKGQIDAGFMADPSRDVFCCAVQHVLLLAKYELDNKLNACLVSLNCAVRQNDEPRCFQRGSLVNLEGISPTPGCHVRSGGWP